MSPSKIAIGWKTIACPSCGEMITVSGATWGDEPEHLTVQCDWCRKVIALTKDPASGDFVAKRVKPS